MRKFALALLVTVAALPAGAENLPIVIRGSTVVRVDVPAPPSSSPVVVCAHRPNSIGGLTVTRCRTLDELEKK